MQTIDRQIIGAIVIVLAINIFYISKTLIGQNQTNALPPFSEQKKGFITVELTGDSSSRGIYFLPAGSTLSGLLSRLEINNRNGFSKKDLERILVSGDVIKINKSDGGKQALVKDGLADSKRYVLDLPINVNTATAADLMLVPGIGEKTADAILETRKGLDGFKEMDDLLQVRGVGEKKLENFKKYLYVKKN